MFRSLVVVAFTIFLLMERSSAEVHSSSGSKRPSEGQFGPAGVAGIISNCFPGRGVPPLQFTPTPRQPTVINQPTLNQAQTATSPTTTTTVTTTTSTSTTSTTEKNKDVTPKAAETNETKKTEPSKAAETSKNKSESPKQKQEATASTSNPNTKKSDDVDAGLGAKPADATHLAVVRQPNGRLERLWAKVGASGLFDVWVQGPNGGRQWICS